MTEAIPAMISGQTVLILKEGTSRSRGKEAQRGNITAANIVAESVKSSLGPKGMDKMLVDSLGDVTITNDGATILKEMDIQHPAAKMMVEIAKATDDEVGDGTTSVVVFAGRLLEKAQDLIDQNIHSTIIVDGYKVASEKALEYLKEIAIKVAPTDVDMLMKAAITTLSSKMVSGYSKHLGKIAVDAIMKVAQKTDEGYKIDLSDVKVDKKAGESLEATCLIEGIVLDKEVVHSGMPKTIKNAKIALLNTPLEIEKTEFTAKINIENPEEMKAFLDEEENMLKNMVEKVTKSGANVIVCQKGIDDVAQHFLAKAGVLAVRRSSESNMEKLSKATGAKIVVNIDGLTEKDLGHAQLVEERKLGDDKWVFVEGCKNPNALTILIRGGTEKVIDEAERAIHDTLCVVKDIMQRPYVVAGGGAPEIEISSRLRKWAGTLSGKEQLAAIAFAEALEIVPTTLAENSGLDHVDILVDLRSRHEKGEIWAGIDAMEGRVTNMSEIDVYEPLIVKEQIIKAASEAASMILRIDDVIAASKSAGAGMPPRPPGGPGGEGGPDLD
ncbi:TCP-1/cpn60 chaperonin family protein [Candidatus Bathyarchaeota archaeon]|nr:TCP-1/cpn60 chaperonin family protein [Candidatus Bathyarchaeota archaeon]